MEEMEQRGHLYHDSRSAISENVGEEEEEEQVGELVTLVCRECVFCTYCISCMMYVSHSYILILCTWRCSFHGSPTLETSPTNRNSQSFSLFRSFARFGKPFGGYFFKKIKSNWWYFPQHNTTQHNIFHPFFLFFRFSLWLFSFWLETCFLEMIETPFISIKPVR